ncbi:MAG: hypothetical protein E6Q97_05075 [Desulfurellales bacterium]|nr:MAG: hypothetical protein E6Q97_05075 [Desulfurellales bacterium]
MNIGIPELKPCPFCGGEARLDRLGESIQCIKCDASGPSAISRYYAAEKWNKVMSSQTVGCSHNSHAVCGKCYSDEAIAERDRLRNLLTRAYLLRHVKAYEPVPVQELWREIEAEVMR